MTNAIGKRVPDQEADEAYHGHWYFGWAPGDFGKDAHGLWWVCPPDERFREIGAIAISKHTVTEHEDGTITVSPSILVKHSTAGEWHGWLERGQWRTA